MTDTPAPVETDNAAAADDNAEAVTQPVPAATTTSDDWKASLPEDLRGHPTLEKFTSTESLAKSYINAAKMIGADKVIIPKEGDEEGWNQVWTRLGRPDSVEGYEFKPPEQIPEGLQYSAEVDGKLSAMFHKRGLPKSMAAGLRDDLIGLVTEGGLVSLEQKNAEAEAQEKAIERAEKALQAEWGDAFSQRSKMALKAAEANFPPDAFAALEANGSFNNPSVVKALYDLGLKVQGEKQLIGDIALEASPGDLDAAISKFQADNMAALTDKAHPDHARVVAERNRLFVKRYG